MATHIPAKLKAADLSRFIVRASQLETAKPIIAYWCEYWIVNQILSKGLHNGDNETLQYTTTLMDKLEQIKADNATNDAIIDDTAGQAYVEQFALETFQRADRAVQANKVTKQTADTFQAAATFFELVNIWGPPDTETQAKIKYAKWNAVRITKAIREGVDPNESNPKPEPQAEEGLPALDQNDPEVQQFESKKPRQASVEEVPDEQDRIEARLARQSSIDQSLHPSAQVSARGSPGPADPGPYDPRNQYMTVQDDNVSPLEPSPPNDRNGSVGGGYFPEVPTFTSQPRDSTLPTAPSDDVIDLGLPDQPFTAPGSGPAPDISPASLPDKSFIPGERPTPPPQDYYHQAPPPPSAPSTQHVHYPPPAHPQAPQAQHLHQTYQQPLYQPPPVPVQHFATAAAPPAPAVQSVKANQPLNTDDMAIAKAQKHARWAISALNFEDAETAVRELKAALQTLGAQ